MKKALTVKRQRQLERLRIERRAKNERRPRVSLARRARTQRTRRDFLKQTAGIALGLGVSSLLPAAAAAADDKRDTKPKPSKEGRTLFFNLSHEQHAGKTYFVSGGGQTHRLTAVAEEPRVLARACTTNAFLRGVAGQVTHHVENLVAPDDSITWLQVTADIDTSAGTWQLSGMYQVIPPAAQMVAYERARPGLPPGPLPLSMKRQRYGQPPALTAQDLIDESALLDATDHAATLIAAHPDLMALEPTAAATVHNNHVGRSIQTFLLGEKITQLGPSMPQTVPGTPNPTGWSSLQPLFDSNGNPIRKTTGPNAGRLQYHNVLHPEVMELAGKGAGGPGGVGVIPQVKDDTTLGADITTVQEPDAYTGVLWYRRDGRPNVDQSPSSGFRATNFSMALKQQGPQSGLDTSATATENTDGTITVNASFTNWYLRYLGAYVQFLDDGGTPIQLSNIAEYTNKTLFDPSVGHVYLPESNSADKPDKVWLGIVPAITTIMGIPLETSGGAGSLTPSFLMPKSASTARLLVGGLGKGSQTYPDTLNDGIGMTSFFCYGVTALCASAGAGAKYPIIINTLAKTLGEIANNLAAFLVDKSSGADTAQFWSDQAESIVLTILGDRLPNVLATMVGLIIGIITESEVEDAIPIIGTVNQVISALIGAADIILTSVDVGLSPWTYVNDLDFTYDLSVSLSPGNSNTFPAAADAYKVTAMIDNGTPHVQSLTIPQAAPSSLPPVVFSGIPLGGNLNVSVSFVQSAITATADDILLGKGSTSLVPNDGSAKSIQVTEIAFPIGPTTKYEHQTKTFLDDNNNHVWMKAAAPTANLSNTACGGTGSLCGYNAITVRQGTPSAEGYLGYAWQGQNQGGPSQADQLANVNTGSTAQSGYAALTSGIVVGGVRVAYNLLTHGTSNFYLDTTDANAPVIRQITLDGTPQIMDPASKQAWGVLNMASDALLLHPAGHVISVNSANHKIETHQIPAKGPMADSDAKVQLIAQVRSGKGSRPGLIDSPVAAAVTADGHLLVLEAGNNRIHALDIGANPVQYFTKQAAPYFLTLDATPPDQQWQHLDIAAEYTGFIYVLSYNQSNFEYQMNIYHPTQADTQPIATTSSFNAARLTVDFWRSVYALNYEVIPRLNPDNPNPPPVTEPSVSLWTPCNVGQTCQDA